MTIKWENVENGLAGTFTTHYFYILVSLAYGILDQFDKYSLLIIDELGASYDYGSVMHYGTP